MHKVKCKYCGVEFDRDKESFIQISPRRYAHPKCHQEADNNKSQEQKDQEELEKYIMKLFNETYLNARVKKQIKDFKEEYNYTYSGMLKTLIYWYEVKGNSIEKANGGIGIIPYVYKDSMNYYYSLYLAAIANQDKNIEKYKPLIKEFSIESPRTLKKEIHLFNLDDMEEE